MPTITNCHIHTFTLKHVPEDFLPGGLHHLVENGVTRDVIVWALRRAGVTSDHDMADRYANLIEASGLGSQEDVFNCVKERYPEGTRFVVMPMDMRGMECGKIEVGIDQQHQDLVDLRKKTNGLVIPFAHIDPRQGTDGFSGSKAADALADWIGQGCAGIKLYPPLGYHANDGLLMPIYELANADKGLPVMVHCSAGATARKKGWSNDEVNKATEPWLYKDIVDSHENMRLCLGHFGGMAAWEDFLNNPWSVSKDAAGTEKPANWLSQILKLIRTCKHGNVYADISYTLFKFQENIDILKVLLSDDVIRSHVLFGSDYYMTEREDFSERKLCMLLRAGLGEEWFWQIAEKNPKAYLGEGI